MDNSDLSCYLGELIRAKLEENPSKTVCGILEKDNDDGTILVANISGNRSWVCLKQDATRVNVVVYS